MSGDFNIRANDKRKVSMAFKNGQTLQEYDMQDMQVNTPMTPKITSTPMGTNIDLKLAFYNLKMK